jgi:hypothetical protein
MGIRRKNDGEMNQFAYGCEGSQRNDDALRTFVIQPNLRNSNIALAYGILAGM